MPRTKNGKSNGKNNDKSTGKSRRMSHQRRDSPSFIHSSGAEQEHARPVFTLRDAVRNMGQHGTGWSSNLNLRYKTMAFIPSTDGHKSTTEERAVQLEESDVVVEQHTTSTRTSTENVWVNIDSPGTSSQGVKAKPEPNVEQEETCASEMPGKTGGTQTPNAGDGSRADGDIYRILSAEQIRRVEPISSGIGSPGEGHEMTRTPPDLFTDADELPSSPSSTEEVIIFTGRSRIRPLMHHPEVRVSDIPHAREEVSSSNAACQLDALSYPLASRAKNRMASKLPKNTWDDPPDNWVHRGQRGSAGRNIAQVRQKFQKLPQTQPLKVGKQRRTNAVYASDDAAIEEVMADYIENVYETGLVDDAYMPSSATSVKDNDFEPISPRTRFGADPSTSANKAKKGSTEKLKRGTANTTELFEEQQEFYITGSTQDEHSDADSDISNVLSVLLDDGNNGMMNDQDLINRKATTKYDEKIARLLAKQEELHLGSDELLLFDDVLDDESNEEDKEDFIPLAESSRRRKRRRRRQPPVPNDDMLDAEEYGDWEPWNSNELDLVSSKAWNSTNGFGLSDSELDEALQTTFAADRHKKKLKKREREELRAQGLLGKKSRVKAFRNSKHDGGTIIDILRIELRQFLLNDQHSCALPPMDKRERRIVHEFAAAFALKSKSAGSGRDRFPVLYKTARSKDFNEAIFARVESRMQRSFFPRITIKGASMPRRKGGGSELNGPGISYGDGEVVGAGASELGVENRGRAMLEKMGWSSGTALGAVNNKGILLPVMHVVKTSRAGLG